MISSFSLKELGATTVGLGRVVIVAAGLGALAVALYRTPVWLNIWNIGAVVVAIVGAVTLLALAIGVAIRGKARAIERISIEISLLACALIAAEAILLLRAPEKWSDDPALQELSMGMSHDFEAAIVEGATMVRIGTALFGER